MPSILNIAAYQFATLGDLPALRARLLAHCREWQIKGTILLSIEGINLFVAGEPARVEQLLAELRAIAGLEDLQTKRSATAHQPFTRMLVRLKREIIAFGIPGIEPARRTSPKLSALELKRWLDEGRPITLLDTRNDYEVKLGTFRNALPIGIDQFRDFPAAVAKLPPALKQQPVVMFCTGGIRCEKAGPYMESQGFKHILQLDGGILKYFEQCGAAHYDGECFVFDQRVGVDPALQETESTQCYHCLTPLTEIEQQDARYVSGRSCPHCYQTPAERMASTIARRHTAIAGATSPMPGSRPYDNYKPLTVPQTMDGTTLLELLCHALGHLPVEHWRQECARGLMLNARHEPVTADQTVRAGERYLHKFPDVLEPDVNGAIEILHEDEALVVLNKPAPLPMHAGGRFYRNTLQYILEQVYKPQKPRPAHRLDANTTGVVLVARTRHHAGRLQPQFANGEVSKHYLVRVQGLPASDRFDCDAPIGVAVGELGTRAVDCQNGLPSRTEFRVLQRNPDGTSLLEARPRTGRTNQIRIHCAHLGLPVQGDTAYLRDGLHGDRQTLAPDAPPLCLHAWKIAFNHPQTGERMEFQAPPPGWASSLGELGAVGAVGAVGELAAAPRFT
jgi:RluA family pseudouridine synthase